MTDRTVPTEPTLLPCPFCGGCAEELASHDGASWVRCTECTATGADGRAPDFRAVENWNRRAASPAAPGAEVEPGDVAYAKVRVDTQPNKDGWCFCTPACHPSDIERGLKPEFDDKDQIHAQVFASTPTTDAIRAQARREALEGAMAAALSRKMEWARKAAEPGRSDHDVAVFESAASAAAEIHADIERLAGKPGEVEGWRPEAEAPEGVWCRTRREGEAGENVCCLRVWPDGDREWIERGSGVTTVTHHSFAAPTHWRPLPAPPSAQGGGDAGQG